MRLRELCSAAGAVCTRGEGDPEITGISADSRSVSAGGMYLCIRGLHTDGKNYIGEALKKGAVAILLSENETEPPLPEGIFLLRHRDVRVAYARLMHAWFGYPSRKLHLIAVTGTNGKTSVTHMLRAILENALFRCGLIGTVGCESGGHRLEAASPDPLANLTTPDPPQLYRTLSEMVRDGTDYVIMEASSHALALGKLEPLTFDAAVFTNLTPEHLDFHKTMEAYAAAKATLFEKSRLSVINADSPYAGIMLEHASGRCVTCGIQKKNADYRAEEIELLAEQGVRYLIRSASRNLRLYCPIPGEFTVMNSMQAAVTALELGCTVGSLKEGLSTANPVRGRMERVRLGLGADFSVLIDYAHTPDALENLLRMSRGLCREGGRIVLLFGCGGDRDRGKRAVMGRIASRLADCVILTSDNSRSEDPMEIIAQIRAGMPEDYPVRILPDRREAIRSAILEAGRNDLILLAGKGHEEYEINRNGRQSFSERAIVKEAFAERLQAEQRKETGAESES